MSLGNQSKLNAGSFAGGGIARRLEIQYAQRECKQKQRAQEKFSEQRAATAVLASAMRSPRLLASIWLQKTEALAL